VDPSCLILQVIKLTKHAYEASGLPLVGVDKPSAYKDQPAPEGGKPDLLLVHRLLLAKQAP
jgi:hypothetical protein